MFPTVQQRRPFRTLASGLLALGLIVATGFAVAAEQDFSLNLRNADIGTFIETVAEITGHNFVIDPRVSGKITVISSRPTTADQIYEIFLSTLKVNGYVAIPSGQVIKIVPEAGSKHEAGDGSWTGTGDALVTRVVEVDHVNPAQLAASLRPLLPANAHISPHPESGMLVISDTSANIKRLMFLIEQIDRAADSRIDVVPLRNASAEEMVNTITRLSRGGAKGANAQQNIVADARSNSILLSGPNQFRTELRALIVHLDTPSTSTGNTEVVYLKHAVAEEMQKVLDGVAESAKGRRQGGGTSGTYDVRADASANALILTAPADVMRELRVVIDKLDIPRAQVHVEGIIAEISGGRAAELGIEWQTSGSADVQGFSRNALSGSTASTIGGGFPAVVGQGFSLGYFSGGDIRALLRALSSDTATKVLSTPSIVTLENEKAVIHVGQNVPFVTGQFTNDTTTPDNPFQTFERQDVGIKLTVTPQINEGDTVRLQLRQEVSSVVPGTSGTELTTNERTIETTVQLEDGDILALGGLISDDLTEQESSVPVLGDIPGIGALFTSRRKTLERKNLVVFLRSSILRDPDKTENLTRNRYQDIRELQQRTPAGDRPDPLRVPPPAALPPYPPPEGQSTIREQPAARGLFSSPSAAAEDSGSGGLFVH